MAEADFGTIPWYRYTPNDATRSMRGHDGCTDGQHEVNTVETAISANRLF